MRGPEGEGVAGVMTSGAARSVECVVVGAGGAGLAAAATAARHGARVMLVDDNAEPGGRHLRPRPAHPADDELHRLGPEQSEGHRLMDEVVASEVEVRLGTVAWGVFDGSIVALASADGAERVHARTLILAPGGTDRPVPFPGWTLSGVIGGSAARSLAGAPGSLAGRRVLVAGSGASLLALARDLLRAGVRVVAVCEAASMLGLWRQAPHLLSHLDAAQAALRAWQEIRAAGVPILAGHLIRRAVGAAEVAGAVVSRCDPEWRPVDGTERGFDVDAVVVDYGLTPASELARLAGCVHWYAAEADAWLPERTRDLEGSAPGVFVVGEAAGARGPAKAMAEGRLAGLVVAGRLDRLVGRAYDKERARARGRLLHLDGLSRALDRIYRVGPGLYELADEATVLCRCEGVSVGDALGAVADGAMEVNEVKAATRAGMGRCQGRMCGPALAHLIARGTRRPVSEAGVLTPRPPIRPVLLGALAQETI